MSITKVLVRMLPNDYYITMKREADIHQIKGFGNSIFKSIRNKERSFSARATIKKTQQKVDRGVDSKSIMVFSRGS